MAVEKLVGSIPIIYQKSQMLKSLVSNGAVYTGICTEPTHIILYTLQHIYIT
jgi:hypothetical protein